MSATHEGGMLAAVDSLATIFVVSMYMACCTWQVPNVVNVIYMQLCPGHLSVRHSVEIVKISRIAPLSVIINIIINVIINIIINLG